MRIVGGRLGGRRFDAPEGEGTRPTSERVREALASALDSRGLLVDARVLDLFAGTGALGFEALSRGASSLCCVEQDPRVVKSLRAAAGKLGIDGACEVVAVDAFSARLARVLTGKRFDLVFVDPPYKRAAEVPALLDALFAAGVLSEETTVAFEHDSKNAPPDPVRFATFARYEYGSTSVRLLCAAEAHETQ